jgi:hypothetical protein
MAEQTAKSLDLEGGKKILRDISQNTELKEGDTTKMIEQVTARIPSVGYLGLAIGAMGLSAFLAFSANRKEYANFVGLWAPTILIMGLYNKLVKVEGSE